MQIPHFPRPATLFETETKSRIRIVLVEDHSLMRECLRALIEVDQKLHVVGEFENAETGLDGIRDLQPDVLLTDLALPGRSGIDLLGEVDRISPMTRKLVLTAHANIHYVSAAMGAGADGYVLKSAGSDELMRAIRTVYMGRQFLCKAIIAQMPPGFFNGYDTPTVPAAMRAITEREREVLTRVAAGHSTKAIARNLGVSPQTVAKHRANLMRKLHLHSIAAVTKFAIRNGLTGSSPYPSPVATEPRSVASLN
ncbi:MAG TPA: response regulator transcription factor [Steroidobacteraceae bacterium]